MGKSIRRPTNIFPVSRIKEGRIPREIQVIPKHFGKESMYPQPAWIRSECAQSS